MKPHIYLYTEPACPSLSLPTLALYLKCLLPFEVEVRPSFFSLFQGEPSELALGFARAKVRNPLKAIPDFPPLAGEGEYERRRLLTQGPLFGIIYDGLRIMKLCQGLLPAAEKGLGHLHILFTQQLLATWEEGRYHLRVGLFGFPNLISTTGLVEAPAKPREFYFLKQQFLSLGMPDATVLELEKEFEGRYLKHDDPQLTEVMKGYVMQAVFHHLTGDPFCEDKSCRLYNAHWQEEVIWAQLLSTYQFCPRHRQVLEGWRKEKDDFPPA